MTDRKQLSLKERGGKAGEPSVATVTPKRGDTMLRWRRFAENYAVSLDPVESAIRAGFDPLRAKTTAAELLKNPMVLEWVEAFEQKRRAALQFDDREIIAELVAIGFSDVRDYLDIHPTTGKISIKPMHHISGVAAKAIQEIYETANGAVRLRLHNKMEALERLGVYAGTFRDDRRQREVDDDLTRYTDDDLERMIAEYEAAERDGDDDNGQGNGGEAPGRASKPSSGSNGSGGIH